MSGGGSETMDLLLVDHPADGIRRLTLNRPDKRNALSHPLRGALLDALVAADVDDSVRVTVVRGAGSCFSSGYDLGGGNEGHELPFPTTPGDGQWPRHVTDGWMGIWDLAKQGRDEDAIVAELAAEFEVPESELRADVAATLNDLVNVGALVPATAGGTR